MFSWNVYVSDLKMRSDARKTKIRTILLRNQVTNSQLAECVQWF